MNTQILRLQFHVRVEVEECLVRVTNQKKTFGSLHISLRIVFVKAGAYAKLVDGFHELFRTGISQSPQVEVLWDVVLCFFNAPVDILQTSLEVLKIVSQDCSVIKQVGIGIIY